MTKKFSGKRCIHCLKNSNEFTSDHVFPQSWYPDTTPKNIEKWQAPSCPKCNYEYSKIEHDLLLRFGMCIDPENIAARGIAEKALRAVNPAHGKNENDRNFRLKKRIKIIKQLIPQEKIDYKSIIPSKGPQKNATQQICIPIPAKPFKKMGEKFIRGTTYVLDNQYIDANHIIDVFLVHEINAQPIIKLLQQYGKQYACGPGIIIQRAIVPEDIQSGLYYIEMWDKIYMYGTVTPKQLNSIVSA